MCKPELCMRVSLEPSFLSSLRNPAEILTSSLGQEPGTGVYGTSAHFGRSIGKKAPWEGALKRSKQAHHVGWHAETEKDCTRLGSCLTSVSHATPGLRSPTSHTMSLGLWCHRYDIGSENSTTGFCPSLPRTHLWWAQLCPLCDPLFILHIQWLEKRMGRFQGNTVVGEALKWPHSLSRNWGTGTTSWPQRRMGNVVQLHTLQEGSTDFDAQECLPWSRQKWKDSSSIRKTGGSAQQVPVDSSSDYTFWLLEMQTNAHQSSPIKPQFANAWDPKCSFTSELSLS